ncbi:MAG: PEP-CTERM sorting domain-containing protein [Planctomycetaceae bacterium]
MVKIRFVACLFVMALSISFGSTSVHASIMGITWDWSAFAGTEAGTFTTDGSLVGNAAPAGTYNILDVSMTASVRIPGYVGTSMSHGDIFSTPILGFIWDGSAPTQFFRGDEFEIYTNGINLRGSFSTGDFEEPRWIFEVDFFDLLDDDDDSPEFIEDHTIALAPQSASAAVPEPSTLALATLAATGLVVFARRKRK